MNFLSLSHSLISAVCSPHGCRLWINEQGWKHEQREREREEVQGEKGEGREEGDVKTESVSQVFTMHCRRVQSWIEIATALEQRRAYKGVTENLWEKYGRLLWLTDVPAGEGGMQRSREYFILGKMAAEGFYLQENIDRHGADFISGFGEEGKFFMLLRYSCRADSLQHLSTFHSAASGR